MSDSVITAVITSIVTLLGVLAANSRQAAVTETWVKVIEIDDKGRINLSRKDALKEIAEREE